MRRRIRALAVLLPYLVFSLTCVLVAAYAFAFLFRSHSPHNPFAVQFAISGWDVPAHFFGAGLALLLAPLQLSTYVRRYWPALHRIGGWLYASAVLIGGISGLSLAPAAQTGLPSAIGFAMLALLWLGVTGNGIRLAVIGDTAGHRTWMAYSIALTAAAITLRLMLGLGDLFRFPFAATYITAAWCSWLINLAVCAWLLRHHARRGARVAGDRHSVSRRPTA
ncbi:DUF2306 domain-containing protein [Luteimonas terrae]|uniref:DUF2306 domain-containing protein n=1 Tax=Luteimonas terrae TaxID=1530191 RepID=A0ABU1XU82_9GAMM|nr:DUF2306 domain-containing protein [Luteimonas terrae]MDR7192330.1 hypothetical protein [Luteimonas terrae]